MKKIKFLILIVLITMLTACASKEGEIMSENVNKIEYLGHGSLKIILKDGKVCYVDPYAGEDYKEPADLILVTHQHGDHNQIDMMEHLPSCEV